MQFVDHPSCNHSFGAPAGMTEEQVGTLRVQLVQVEGYGPASRSFWKPSAEELAALQRGEHVVLWVYGRGHPVVAMSVEA